MSLVPPALTLAVIASIAAMAGAGWYAYNRPVYITKAKIEAHLNDPESARYRNIVVKAGRDIVCGEVNAKNRFGAYVGFRRFYALVLSGDAFLTIAPDELDLRSTDRTVRELAELAQKHIRESCD